MAVGPEVGRERFLKIVESFEAQIDSKITESYNGEDDFTVYLKEYPNVEAQFALRQKYLSVGWKEVIFYAGSDLRDSSRVVLHVKSNSGIVHR